jgi:thiol:disulfide interchange protein DsbD
MRKLLLLAGLLVLTASLAQAQPKQRITWQARLVSTSPLKVGDVVTVELTAQVAPSYHIYSSVPSPKPAGLPTALELDAESVGAELSGKLSEQGDFQKHYDDVFETDVYYFEGQVTFRQAVKITAPQAKIVGFIRYQVCDSVSCTPGTFNFSYAVAAIASAPARGGAAAARREAPSPAPATAGASVPEPTAQAAAADTPRVADAPAIPAKATATEDTGLLTLFLLSFGAGLIGLLTPCVFPMIPLTVSYFTKRSGTRAQGIRNAAIYSLSIVFIFVVLGLALTLIFGSAALYRLASNPWLNLVFFVILFAFALSFLGWFEIQLPSAWVNSADAQTGKGGITGIFFMALTLVLVSFSCTGPLVGSLLVQAAAGNILGPVVGMLGFSLAFALPFGAFALFPNALNALPKSGGWLNAVKVVLGFLELALALKFLSNADLVWHLGILDREIYLAGWIVIFTLLGFYLLGKLRLPHDSPSSGHVSVPRLLLATFTFTFVLYLVPGLWGAPLKGISNFLPPVNDDIGVKPAGYVSGFGSAAANPALTAVCNVTDRKYAEQLSKSTPPGFCTFYDLEQARAYARLVGKPLFIDFTGHTCVNCRDMEAKVWPDARVRKHLNEDYVMVQLYVDDETKLTKPIVLPDGNKLRTIGDAWLHFQQTEYQTNAQPYYILADADLNLLMPARAYDTAIEPYVAFLESGIEMYKQRHK